jgi:uncharacterized protein HemY
VNEIKLDVLDQTETWTDATGAVHQLSEMEARYCRNVVAFLERHAPELAELSALQLLRCSLPDEATQAYLSVTESLDNELRRLAGDPVGWLNNKPLLKALRARAGKEI